MTRSSRAKLHQTHDNKEDLVHGAVGGDRNQGGRGRCISALEDVMRRQGVEQAWDALEEMLAQGLPADRFTVSRMLMKTVGDGRCRWQPAKVYRGFELVEQFIECQPGEADEVLFNAMLDICCRMKDSARLDATFDKMQELDIQPSHVTLGILVKAHGQAGDISRVMRVWEEMDDQRRTANAVTHGCMIDACVKCGHVEKAMDIFQDMRKRRKHRNTILYTTLIKGYGTEKNLKNALMLFEEMKREGVPCNAITYNSIIDVCVKCSDLAAAERLLTEMVDVNSPVSPDLITYSTLLKGYCHAGELDKALQVAETIRATGLQCDELVYNTLMDGCVKTNDMAAGIGLFSEMIQEGMMPSSITHSILLRLHQKNGLKGDAVGRCYEHHGLQNPMAERGKNSCRRGQRRRKTAAGDGESQRKGRGHAVAIAPGPVHRGDLAPDAGAQSHAHSVPQETQGCEAGPEPSASSQTQMYVHSYMDTAASQNGLGSPSLPVHPMCSGQPYQPQLGLVGPLSYAYYGPPAMGVNAAPFDEMFHNPHNGGNMQLW